MNASRARPPVPAPGEDLSPPLLRVHGLTRTYQLPRRSLRAPGTQVHALRGVDLEIPNGKSVGIVGASGSGKSTLARLVMALDRPSSGSVHLFGQDLHQLTPAQLRRARQDFQMVFQDPYGSLDPRMTVERIVREPLAALTEMDRDSQQQRVVQVMEQVGLRSSDLQRYPHEFSGGQRQRIAIARAIATRPRLVVADEPVSALDVSVQAQVLNLLRDLQTEYGLSYLLISHDLAVVQHLCDEVLVLHQGEVVERGAPRQLFTQARHPYTQSLVQAVPRMPPSATAV